MTVLLPLLGLLLVSNTNAAPQEAPSATSLAPSSTASATPQSLTSNETATLFEFHEKLVNIPSISDDEIECSEFLLEYLTSYLTEFEFAVEKVLVDSGAPGRFNVFAYPSALQEAGEWPEVLISSHIDTVPPFIPFERREENGTTYHYGRGTVDAKGPIAAMVVASRKFLESRSDSPSLGLLFVVGEETGGDGMRAFASYASNATFRAGIFGEPTESMLASGHKGTLGLTLDVVGRSAHSAYPWLGVSAINYLSEAIVAMNSLEPALPRSELLGPSTLNVGVVEGGLASNVIAPNATAGITIRIARSEEGSVEAVRDMVAGMISPIVQRTEAANATFNVTFSTAYYPAQILDTDVPGLEEAPVFFGTDIPLLPQVEQRYLFGSGSIQVAHTPDEGLSQEELVRGAEGYGLILQHVFSGEVGRE